MKKALSLFLSLALMAGLCLPAAAAQPGMDEALTQVTAKVKQTLDIADTYDTFYGELSGSGENTYWSLNWSGETAGSLMVEADESGKVMSYYRSFPGQTGESGTLPAFPATSRAQAQAIARDFLDKVLETGLEAAQFDPADSAPSTVSGQYRFSGTITLHGLTSPIGFSVTVQASDGAVLRFYRDDLYAGWTGGVPSSEPAVGLDAAAQALKGTLALRLEYVSDEEGRAVLRYLPEETGSWYVDAQTGELVDLTERYAVPEDGGTGESSDNAAEGNGLSQAEQEGIARLEGVLSRQTLDQAVRDVDALALDGFALSQFQYWVDRESDEVFASLRYEAGQGEAARWRLVVVDARSGDLCSVSGGRAYDSDRTPAVTQAQAQARAEAFLAALWDGQFAQTALYQTQERMASGYYSFTYAQQVNGYFFPENSLSVWVDAQDGSICGLSRDFEAQVSFDSPEGLVSDQAALDAWFGTYTAVLGYLAVPDENGERVSLTLAYYLDQKAGYTGIDAKTGAPVQQEETQQPELTYDDLQNSWAREQIEALADYGIGYYGGSFQPEKALTQLDLLALLASVQGYRYLPGEEAAEDNLYSYAYGAGLLTPDQREDGAVLTRGETVKLLLDSAGYGEVAALQGIFRCSYSDEGEIPAAYYGYAALAQGMGIVGGDTAGRFAADRTATRQEAAVMLYNYMNR